jgi:hypothetical protein
MSSRFAQFLPPAVCLPFALLAGPVPAAAQTGDYLNVKVQLQISAACGGPDIVNTTVTTQLKPSFTPTGVSFGGKLVVPVNAASFSCSRNYIHRGDGQMVPGEERFTITPRPNGVAMLTVIWPSQYVPMSMTNLLIGIDIGRCSSESYARGKRFWSFTSSGYGAQFVAGSQNGAPTGNASPPVLLTKADATNGFSNTYTIKGIGACGESSLGEKGENREYEGPSGHMLNAVATVTLSYKSANQAQVAIAKPCADIVVGQTATVTAKGTPAGGQYDWTGTGGVHASGSGATATLTGDQPGHGRVKVSYTSGTRTASDEKPVTCLRVNGLNGGAPIPVIGLFDVEAKPITTPIQVALSVQPADAGDNLSFTPANRALLSVTSRGDALLLQGVRSGKTQVTGKTSCGQSVGGPWPVEVRRCTDEVVAKIAEEERIAREAFQQQASAAQAALNDKEFEQAADGLADASGELILKTGALIVGTLGGEAGGTTGAVSDAIGHAMNFRDMANAQNGWDQLSATSQEFVQSAGGPFSQAIAGAIDVVKTANDFGNKLGKVMGTNEQVESARKGMENFARLVSDAVRRKENCKEAPSAQQPPEPKKPDTPTPGQEPPPSKQPPGKAPAGQPPAPPGEPPPGQEQPPGEPPPIADPPFGPGPGPTGLPYQPGDPGCTCGAAGAGAVLGTAYDLRRIDAGMGSLKSCNDRFVATAQGFEGALEAFKGLLTEMAGAAQVPAAQRPQKAKEWSARLDVVIDRSKQFETAGKAVLGNGKACSAALGASVGVMGKAAKSPLEAN